MGVIFGLLLATWITVGLRESLIRESVPPHHSLVHAQEVAAVLRRHYDEAPLLLLRKDELPRKNAIYYFMASDSFARMQHSARFDEFASYIAQGHKRRELVENGVSLSCGMDREGRTPPNRVPGINDWQVDQELDLNGCTTCLQCRLYSLRRQ